MERQKATFAAGCFWGVESAFQKIRGVFSTSVGYLGGTFEHPSYQDVCSGKTGHAEVVELEYNPNHTAYEDLLRVFWDIHDPTSLNRQGLDVGTQYRSAVFFHTPEQETAARTSKEKLQASNRFNGLIVTDIRPASQFYRAEEYHQQYFVKLGFGHSPSRDGNGNFQEVKPGWTWLRNMVDRLKR